MIKLVKVVLITILITLLVYYVYNFLLNNRSEADKFVKNISCQSNIFDVKNDAEKNFEDVHHGYQEILEITTDYEKILVTFYDDNSMQSIERLKTGFFSYSGFYLVLYCENEIQKEIQEKRKEEENKIVMKKIEEMKAEREKYNSTSNPPTLKKKRYKKQNKI